MFKKIVTGLIYFFQNKAYIWLSSSTNKPCYQETFKVGGTSRKTRYLSVSLDSKS